MSRIPLTLRIDAKESAALKTLSKVEGRPVNQIINDAIRTYLRQKSPSERTLEGCLASLRAYRKQDPGFQRAIAAFVEAEASLDDPAEGRPVEGKFNQGRFKPSGPVQTKIRELLDA